MESDMDPSESEVLKNLSHYVFLEVLMFNKYFSHMERFNFLKIMLGKTVIFFKFILIFKGKLNIIS